MITIDLYNKYINNDCEFVWQEIAFSNYYSLENEERNIIKLIFKEALNRIDFNFKIVFTVLNEYGYQYVNLGGINSYNSPYLLEDYNDLINKKKLLFSKIDSSGYLPLFFAEFNCFYKVVDFRGVFKDYKIDYLLDPFFIESFKSLNEVKDFVFEFDFNDNQVEGVMFSPDQYIKEDLSGDIGPGILLSQDLLIDNYIVNYFDDFKMTFVQYLNFCFYWACFPSLYWVSDSEKEIFMPILKKVRQLIKKI